jgi:hypothetical protein
MKGGSFIFLAGMVACLSCKESSVNTDAAPGDALLEQSRSYDHEVASEDLLVEASAWHDMTAPLVDIGKLNCLSGECGSTDAGCACLWTCSDTKEYEISCEPNGVNTFLCRCRKDQAEVKTCTSDLPSPESCALNTCCSFPL